MRSIPLVFWADFDHFEPSKRALKEPGIWEMEFLTLWPVGACFAVLSVHLKDRVYAECARLHPEIV